MELRGRHRAILQGEHQAYGGQVLQYYGDGTLSRLLRRGAWRAFRALAGRWRGALLIAGPAILVAECYDAHRAWTALRCAGFDVAGALGAGLAGANVRRA